MTKEIMNRLAPSLLVVNFWDIDIAHYGAYSLYLEAIRRTDRLVHELWQHAQSLPQYRDRTTLLVVPELGRDGDVVGNGFANHRSGDESCRRVWLVAVGAGVPKGAGTERPIRTTDVAPTVARILGFKMPACEGRPLAELAF
jgi:bisphosphoglycerate-independent phosphoglycerate mutase (AlkP superfamily)